MNDARRKALRKLANEVRDLETIISEAISKAEDLHSELESLKDEEQEYYDNMPESLQGGDKGQAAEEAIQNLESALEFLDALKDFDFNEGSADQIESACG